MVRIYTVHHHRGRPYLSPSPTLHGNRYHNPEVDLLSITIYVISLAVIADT